MARSRRMAAALAVVTLLTTGCGVAAAPADTPATGGAGNAMCAPEAPDCEDTVTDDASDDDHRARARALLGTAEADLPEDVRVGRRGDEQMMLTEDYRVGRLTVELDPADDGTFVVTSVTVELEAGPETVRG